MELENDTGMMVFMAMVVASLATLSTSWLSGMSEWPGIHLMKMEDEMELMKLWMKEVQGFDDMRASHKDLLSVQTRMVIDEWFGSGGCPG